MKVAVQWTLDAEFEIPDGADPWDNQMDQDSMVRQRKELSDEIARLLEPIRSKLGEFSHYATEIDEAEYDDGEWSCWPKQEEA